MANDEDPDKWLMGGPVAWFAMAAIVAIIVGAVGWGYAEFRADRAVRDALALAADEPARESLRNELDLAAQQTMATAAIVATVLSALSMAFVALTVWFTRDASVQARKSLALSQRALIETIEISKRELMPYLNVNISVDPSEISEIDLNYDVKIFLDISNHGKTPCHVTSIYFDIREFISETDTSFPPSNITSSLTIGPDKNEKKYLGSIYLSDLMKSIFHRNGYIIYIKFHCSTIYEKDLTYVLTYKSTFNFTEAAQYDDRLFVVKFIPSSLSEYDSAIFRK